MPLNYSMLLVLAFHLLRHHQKCLDPNHCLQDYESLARVGIKVCVVKLYPYSFVCSVA